MEVDSGSEGLVSVDEVRSERPGVVDPHPSSLPPLSVSASSSLPEEIHHSKIPVKFYRDLIQKQDRVVSPS